MSILKNIFRSKDQPIQSYEDFWNWFQKNAKTFHKVVKEKGNVEKEFFDKLGPKLNEVKEGFLYLTGMSDLSTVELAITANGAVKNFVFAEELIAAAPNIEGWKFVALIPALDIKDVSIDMSGYKFSEQNLSFYSNEHPDFPDEIDITIVHADCNDENRSAINNGIFIFLDNYLGELALAVTIDNIIVATPAEAEKELIPIGKLKEFINWRQKEFLEKYEGEAPESKEKSYAVVETERASGERSVALVNTALVNWDRKASHPWILQFDLPFDETNNEMPDEIENKISGVLEQQACLKIGRQTTNDMREIYFACKDFRLPSKIVATIQKEYASHLETSYDIYIDKYWSTFDRFKKPA